MRPRTARAALAAAVAGTAFGLAACRRPEYVIAGGAERSGRAALVAATAPAPARFLARAEEAPRLDVAPASLFLGGEVSGTVAAHGETEKPGTWRLVVAVPGAGVGRILYTPPGGLSLPVLEGESVRVLYTPPVEAPSLVVRDAEGRLLAAVAAGGDLPQGALGGDLSISPSRRLAFTEVRQLPSLCTALVEHHFLRIGAGADGRYLAPGTWDRVKAGERVLRLLVLDVSEPADDRCAGEIGPRVAYAVLLER